MGKKHHIDPSELERDEVAESLQGFASYLRENRIKLIVVALALVAGGGGGFAWRGYRSDVLEKTSAIVNSAAAIFEQIPGMADETARETRLRETIATLRKDVVERYPDSIAASQALYLIGNCHYYLDETTEAQRAYQDYIERVEAPEDVAKGRIALANAVENEFYFTNEAARLDAAIQLYDTAAREAPAGSYLTYQALMGKARVLELTSRDEEALALYKKVLEERPSPAALAKVEEADRAPEAQTLLAMARRQVDDQMKALSFETTAKLRVDRIEGALELVGRAALPSPPAPEIEGPPTPLLPADAATTATEEASAPAQP